MRVERDLDKRHTWKQRPGVVHIDSSARLVPLADLASEEPTEPDAQITVQWVRRDALRSPLWTRRNPYAVISYGRDGLVGAPETQHRAQLAGSR